MEKFFPHASSTTEDVFHFKPEKDLAEEESLKVTNLNELYIEELRDLYSAETQIAKAVPKIVKAVSTPELKRALEAHLGQTENQVTRLESIFKALDEKAGGHHCKAMEGLLKEGDELISDVEEGPVRDAALIGACQKVEHYELAGYGTAKTFASLLGFSDHVETLEDTENEESAADEKLTNIAMKLVNKEASEGARLTAANRR